MYRFLATLSLSLLLLRGNVVSAFWHPSPNIAPNILLRDRPHSSSSRVVVFQSVAPVHHNHKLNDEIEQLMSKHDPILLFASRLLPPAVASDAAALYAWCRRLDEITDNPQHSTTSTTNATSAATGTKIEEVQDQLDEWQHRFDLLWKGEPVDAMDAALYECLQRHQHRLGKEPFCDMMAGMRADAVVARRIQSMQELEDYGYQVAGTVGLMLLPLLIPQPAVTTTTEQAEDRASTTTAAAARDSAISLGTAIQLINILRDATPDAALGRIYLPQDMLQAQGVRDDDILLALRQPPSEGYRNVVRAVASRAGELLRQAERGKSSLPGFTGPLLVQIIVELYRGYLEQLKTLDYNNLRPGGERVRISTGRKLMATLQAVGAMIRGN